MKEKEQFDLSTGLCWSYIVCLLARLDVGADLPLMALQARSKPLRVPPQTPVPQRCLHLYLVLVSHPHIHHQLHYATTPIFPHSPIPTLTPLRYQLVGLTRSMLSRKLNGILRTPPES